MMAATISNMTKTSVERKPRDGYRFTIDIGTVNAWQFDLSDSEFEEFLRQVARAHGPVLGGCVKTSESTNKPAQTTAPQPGTIYMGTLGTPGVNTLSFVPTPDAEKIQLSASTPLPPPIPIDATNHPDYYGWHPVAECIEVSQHFNGNLAQAIQYIWRCGRKPDVSAVKDLEKSINFLRFEIDRIKRFEGEKWAKENPPI